MAAITPDRVRAALSGSRSAGASQDIVAGGLVSEIAVVGSDVTFVILADPRTANAMEPVRRAAEAAVKKLPEVGKVMVALTAERPAPPQAGAARDA